MPDRQTVDITVPAMLHFSISPSSASPKMGRELAEARISQIRDELADCDHIEDFEVDVDALDITPIPSNVSQTGP